MAALDNLSALSAGRAGAWATKADAAYQGLRSRVLSGAIRPGSRLAQEALAAEMGLSTTPVREAVRRLEAEGLLIQEKHRMVRVPELSRRELSELYSILVVLDPMAARLGARLASEQDKAEVRQLAWADRSLNHLERVTRNRQLHRIMYAAADNKVLEQMLDGLWARSDRYRAVLMSDESVAAAAGREHLHIVDAFCSGDLDRLGELIEQHLAGSRQKLLDLIQ
jgi:DNA-binding GntR family transcriptional regulator